MKTILVVDDEPKILQIARDYLEHAGFSVSGARDGKTALAMVRSARPDLVILDLGLPDMDGLDVCRQVRRDSNVPVPSLRKPNCVLSVAVECDTRMIPPSNAAIP